MKTLLLDHDEGVANWAFERFGFHPTSFCMAIGIMDQDYGLVGACMFHAHSGPDIEVSYYGPNTMTLDIVKAVARIAVNRFGVSRITARTSRRNKAMTRGIRKVGFEFEGVRHCGYGNEDAIMYGLYGKKLARLAGQEMH